MTWQPGGKLFVNSRISSGGMTKQAVEKASANDALG